jgi:DNA polymerase III delta prime subunit
MITFKTFIMNPNKKDILEKLINHDNMKLMFIGECETGKTTIINKIIDYIDIKQYKILRIKNYNDVSINYFRQDVKQFCQMNSTFKKIIIIDDLDFIKDTSQHILCSLMNKFENLQFLYSCKNIRKINDNIINKCIVFELDRLNIRELETFLNIYLNIFNLNLCDKSKQYILNNCDKYPSVIYSNLKCLSLYNDYVKLDVIKEVCNIDQYKNFYTYFTLLKNNNIMDANKLLIHINNNCVSLIDMFELLYNYIKNTNMFDELIKLHIIKIIASYKLLLNTHHERKIEIYFITSDIYYELQKNI